MKRVCKQIRSYFMTIKPKKKYYIPMFSLSFIIALLSAFISWLLALIITSITSGDFKLTTIIFFASLFLWGVFRLFCVLHAYFYTLNKNYNIRYITNKILLKLVNINEDYYEKHTKGETINLLTNEIENVSIFTNEITHIFAKILHALVLLVIITSINFYVGLIAIISSILCVLFKNYCIDKESYYSKRIIEKKDKMIGMLGEIITANYDIKTTNIIKKTNKVYDKYNECKIDLANKKCIWQTLRAQLTPYIGTVFQYTIMGILIYMIYLNRATIDIYIIIIGYYESLISAFDESMDFISILKENDISIERLNSFLNYKENGRKNFGKSKKIKEINSLICEDLSFKYERQASLLLDKISPNFEKGKITAITGKNGKGKSTLFKIILGVIIPKGNIYLNDKSIYEYDYETYLNLFSVVNQKPYFFNQSIMENLSYFCSSKDKIINICKELDLHDFIMSLPNKYDTILSEDAVNISGGQKQKLALARALLKDSKILLLDEFTSSIDRKSIDNIFNILKRLKKDKIIIIITHKQNELDYADIIYELN